MDAAPPDASSSMTSPAAAADTPSSAQQQQQQQQQQLLPPPPRAADLQFIDDSNNARLYWDRSHYDSPASQLRALSNSSTLYVGNLNFSTRMSHIRSHFSMLGGRIKTINMGLDRMRKTPCGFCFVEYCRRQDALAAVWLLSSTKLDGKVIRVELDAGFQLGRQYGRGRKGGQVRDDRKQVVDHTRKRQRMDASNETTSTGPPVDDGATAGAVADGGGGGATNGSEPPFGQEAEQEDKDEPASKRRRMS